MYNNDEFKWDDFAIITVVMTLAAWSLILFGNLALLIQLWTVIGGAMFLGVLIFGSIGVWAIAMDLYTYHKIRKEKQQGK